MLTIKEQRTLVNYQRKLNFPKWKFIILYGWIWGFFVLFFKCLYDYFIDAKSLKQQWQEGLLIDILILLGMSLAYGWFYRKIIEKECKRLAQKSGLL
ncbi:MAG TPA: hypothetical protein VFQ73_00885 [Flavisolibacter sp.]|nr:hypothetical protein [Flavisolibacter sp.]